RHREHTADHPVALPPRRRVHPDRGGRTRGGRRTPPCLRRRGAVGGTAGKRHTGTPRRHVAAGRGGHVAAGSGGHVAGRGGHVAAGRGRVSRESPGGGHAVGTGPLVHRLPRGRRLLTHPPRNRLPRTRGRDGSGIRSAA